MANRDLLRNVFVTQTISPAARVNGTVNGTGVDLRGFDAAVVVVAFGTVTDGTHTPSLQHSADNSIYTNCAASDVDGTFTAATSASSNTVQQVGYIGSQRYIRLVMTTAGATTGGLSQSAVVAGYPRQAPTQ